MTSSFLWAFFRINFPLPLSFRWFHDILTCFFCGFPRGFRWFHVNVSGFLTSSVRISDVSRFFKIFAVQESTKMRKNEEKIKILPRTCDFYEFFKNLRLLFHFWFFHDFLQIFVMGSPRNRWKSWQKQNPFLTRGFLPAFHPKGHKSLPYSYNPLPYS